MRRLVCLSVAVITLLIISNTGRAQTFAPSKLSVAGREQSAKKDPIQVITRETPEVITKETPPQVIAKEKPAAAIKQTPEVITNPPVAKKQIAEVITKPAPPAAKKQVAAAITKPNSQVASKARTFEPVRPIARYNFKTPDGREESVPVITHYYPNQIVRPLATTDRHLDPKLTRAATIAQERAHAHSRSMCWHAVKEALLASGVIDSRPKSEYARDAAQDLVSNYGFKKLSVRDPFAAPIGSVLVYGTSRSVGHVEIRTKDGFVSDFRSPTPSHRPLIGVYAKL
ncbi:MAG TPA: hypothetical protein VJK31_01750 [Chthoniobacterales bacterium]|nr:hypothetical protein [Chthoniobacterales bacterium]